MEIDNEEFQNLILSHYLNNDWRSILNMNVDASNKSARRLMWAWPFEEDLQFIGDLIKENILNGIISVGCGRGLFEWLLEKCTNLPVRGIEVNEAWWKSKYSGPKFIPLHFPKLPPREEFLRHDYALLFCYFNNGNAFREYLSVYKGDLVIIVGPQKGSRVYTDPDPLDPNFGTSDWKLIAVRKIKNRNDIITVFKKV